MESTRRQLLVAGLGTAALAPVASWFPGVTRRRRGERVLVVVQLSGGNDGLNTVVPHRQDEYFRGRPTLGLKRSKLHALDDDHGLHPEMGGLARLYGEGNVAVVQGVGYPHPNRSHFRSMEIWHTADPVAPPNGLGWMGRLADQLVARSPGSLPAIHVGAGVLPLALAGRRFFPPSVKDLSGFQLQGPAALAGPREALLEAGPAEGELAFLREVARTTYRAAERVERAAAGADRVDYPGSALAARLRTVARLVAGGFGARVFHVELGGFDTHARQAAVHAALLGQLSAALTAFQEDLRANDVDDEVVTLVFSEFGRRAAENGSSGTDHGAAAPVFLVGAPVRGGMHGRAPDLTRLVEGDVPHSTDFRSLYTTLERDWMGLEPSSAFPSLELVEA